MNKQTDTDVIINGKKYTLSGYESNDYMQRVASYLNDKCAQMAQQADFRYFDKETQNILIQLNIADDFFKLKALMKHKETDSDTKDNEIMDLRHEIIALQTKLEECEKELEQAKEKFYEDEKKNIRLETELKEAKKGAEQLARERRVDLLIEGGKKETKTMWLPPEVGGKFSTINNKDSPSS